MNIIVSLLVFAAGTLAFAVPGFIEGGAAFCYAGGALLFAAALFLILNKLDESNRKRREQAHAMEAALISRIDTLEKSQVGSSNAIVEVIKNLLVSTSSSASAMAAKMDFLEQTVVKTSNDNSTSICNALGEKSNSLVVELNAMMEKLFEKQDAQLDAMKSLEPILEAEQKAIKELCVNMSDFKSSVTSIPANIKRIGEDMCDKFEEVGKDSADILKDSIGDNKDAISDEIDKFSQYCEKLNTQQKAALSELSRSVNEAMSTLSSVTRMNSEEKELMARIERLFAK